MEHHGPPATPFNNCAWSSCKRGVNWVWRGAKKAVTTTWQYTKRVFCWLWSKLRAFWQWICRQFSKISPFVKTVLFSPVPTQELPPPAYPSGFRPVHFDTEERSMSEDVSFKEVIQQQNANPGLPPIPPPRPMTPALKVTEAPDDEDHEEQPEPRNFRAKSPTPPPVPPKPHSPVPRRDAEESADEQTGSYIQKSNIDLSSYTTKIGGVGPSMRSRHEETNEELTRMTREGSVGPAIEGGFYAQKTYFDPTTLGREGSPAPPPPPPPPPPPGYKPAKLPTAGRKTPVNEGRKTPTSPGGAVKGAVPMLPVSVLEQMSNNVDQFGERTERGRSATVSERVREANSRTPVQGEGRKTPIPDGRKTPNFDGRKTPIHTTTKTTENYFKRESSVPPQGWRPVSAFEPEVRLDNRYQNRAKSVGAQVVSRIEDSPNDEPQYIFRARPTQPYDNIDPSAYLMGGSVYRPVPEAEWMRDRINQRSLSVSRPVTPASTAPFEGNYVNYTNGYTGDDSLRFRNGVYARENTTFSDYQQGPNVNNRIRAWPPPSNVTPMDIQKDYWLNQDNTTTHYDHNGDLVTTRVKRVAEKTIEDNWNWRDENGRLIDSKSERSWRGDMDELKTDGPGAGSHFTRTVEMLPNKDIRFQDTNRQYNNNFMVESIVRNY
ncbi:unnamed protein product, partial [Mesorhabditis spiculigera]